MNFKYEKYIEIEKDDSQTIVFIVFSYYESMLKLFLFNDIEYEETCKDSYLIPANTDKLIYCNYNDDSHFYHFSTFTSKNNNMKILYSSQNEGIDNIIKNNIILPIYAGKDSEDYNVNFNKYSPKFSLFGAVNNYLFEGIYEYTKKYFNINSGLNIDNYLKLTQMNIRINSKLLDWSEFYNIYLNQLNIKINLYIIQIYGNTELYECDADNIDEKNLSFLTTPISNMKCKNRKSIFNRLLTLDGTKIISGYITPDSYFDIYAEINNNNEIIDISPINVTELDGNSTVKYLKKEVIYTIGFNLDHLIKLEPEFDADITITDGQSIRKINQKKPISEII